MINIITHLKSKNPNAVNNINDTAELLWTHLNNPTYNYNISQKLVDLITHINTPSYIAANSAGGAQQRQSDFLDHLNKNDNLHKIIVAKPLEFNTILDDIYKIIDPQDFFTPQKTKAKSTDFGKLLKTKLFNYSWYRSNDLFEVIYNQLDIIPCTCAYCNTGHMMSIEKLIKGKKPVEHYLFEIDHFYPSVRHPYFSLSFFNHIPSCETCNGKLKNDQQVAVGTHLHPFLDCFDNHYTFIPILGYGQNITVESVVLKNETSVNDNIIDTLKIQSRYGTKGFLHFAKANDLVEYIYKNRHKFMNNHPQQADFLASLKISLTGDKNKILYTPYEKLKRDITKQFDIHKVYVK
ncbi:hypothetical protein [Candidatus Pantoea multigeneris]|uniref:HNH endonuclease n=1 Tax=Candidatus Pantoea multigeneris TaxID=2608357 RepID=A0ABX0RCG5_9GAMM|nr:hypothetical protein [Pantoea multigeneris]NIF22001.1 hypothetical protein [Pantoea multigeneris]